MKAKELASIFAGMNPNDEVWITYLTKDDIEEAFSNLEFTDENDNLIDTDKYVNDEVAKIIFGNFTSDQMWEQFSDDLSDMCRTTLEGLIAEQEEATKDEELWDKEITNVS